MTTAAETEGSALFDAFEPWLGPWRDQVATLYRSLPPEQSMRAAFAKMFEPAIQTHAPEQLETYRELRTHCPQWRMFDFAAMRDIIVVAAFVANTQWQRQSVVEGINAMVADNVATLFDLPLFAPMLTVSTGDVHTLCQMFAHGHDVVFNQGSSTYQRRGPNTMQMTYRVLSADGLMCFQRGFYLGTMRRMGVDPDVTLTKRGDDHLELLLTWR